MRTAADGAVYNRQQTGHSLGKHLFFGLFIAYFNLPWIIYYSVSPNHYWHL